MKSALLLLSVPMRAALACDLATSDLVRQLLEEAVPQGYRWTEGCPLADGSTCLADYCDVFGVCPHHSLEADEQQCDREGFVRARRRCDDAVARCFPLDAPATRRLHVQFSRQWCQILHCDAKREHDKGHAETPASLLTMVGVIFVACAAVFLFTLRYVENTGPDCKVVFSSDAPAHTLLSSRGQSLRKRAGDVKFME
jgi:hypothetical protein